MGIDNNYFSTDHNEYASAQLSGAGRGALRVALLFGSAAVALSLIIVPILSERANRQTAQSLFPQGVDMTKTGSIGGTRVSSGYTIHKSVLQPFPQTGCIIKDDGTKIGDC